MRILGLIVLTALTLCLLAQSPARAQPATAPAAAGPLQLIQEIKDGDEGAVIKNHVGATKAVGDCVYASVVYEGLIDCFKRDAATGKLSYIGACDIGNKTSFGNLVVAKGRLYGNGGTGHWVGDQDARGLHYMDIDPATGKLADTGSLPIPISAGLAVNPAQDTLYLVLRDKVVSYTLAADGKPQKAQEAALQLPGLSNPNVSCDGKSLYVLSLQDAKRTLAVAHVKLSANGAMALAEPCDVTKLIADSDFPAGKFGFGWGHGLFLSPDGLNAYVDFYNYGGNKGLLAILKRDPASGALTYDRRVDTAPQMVKLDVAFLPDGAAGYFISGNETCGNCVGAFVRDPKTGMLDFAGTENAARHRGACSIELDTAHGALYAGGWASKSLMVLKTVGKPVAQGK